MITKVFLVLGLVALTHQKDLYYYKYATFNPLRPPTSLSLLVAVILELTTWLAPMLKPGQSKEITRTETE